VGRDPVELLTVAVTELDVRSIPIVGRDTDGVVAPPAAPSVARPWSPLRWLRGAVSRWWTVLAVLVAWQLWLGFTGFNSIVLPRPSDVVSDIVGHPGAYAGDTARTIGLALVGVAVGMTLGFAIAVMTWASSLAAGAIGPLVLMLRSIPIVAVIPVVARVVGYGDKVVPIVTIMLAFFPAYVMTTSGLRTAPPTAVDLMHALGASRWTLLRRVLVPSALPNLFVALRLCASSAVLAAMVAEFLAGTSGLGRLFSNSRVRFDNERAWGAAVIATALSVALFQIALRLERWGRARFR
jgi:ABC-type nitrate/sulfonate/bicarbonate transport system permease component